MKKYPPKRPLNADGVCYTDKFCDIKSNCSKCNNLNPNGTLKDLESEERLESELVRVTHRLRKEG